MHKDENIEKNIIFLKSILFKRLIKKNKLIIVKDKKIKSLLLKNYVQIFLAKRKAIKLLSLLKNYFCIIV